MSKGNASPSLERRRFRPQSIRELMGELGLSRTEFLKRARLQPAQLAGWASGLVTPTIGTVQAVAQRLGVDVTRFYRPAKRGSASVSDRPAG